MTNCKECKNEISNKAHSCPKCGAKIERTSTFTKLVLGLIIFSAVMAVMASRSLNDHREQVAKIEQARLAKLSPEQRAAEVADAEKELARSRKASAQAAIRKEKAMIAIRTAQANLLDPKSAIWKSVRATDEGEIVCLVVAGRNGFGGLTEASFVGRAGMLSKTNGDWNKYCANKTMFDETNLTTLL